MTNLTTNAARLRINAVPAAGMILSSRPGYRKGTLSQAELRRIVAELID